MSGDVVRKRNKDKKKDKKKDEEDAPGVHAGVASENMHAPAHEHGVGWCAKIVFFLLMAILGGLICLIMLENRGGSDLDTPLSESRFSEYLQGWVDEVREDDHHDVAHDPYGGHDDHDDHDADSNEHEDLPEDSPYPEEKDNSENDTEEADQDQDLSAEVNANDHNDSTQDDDGVQSAEEELNVQESDVEENEPIEYEAEPIITKKEAPVVEEIEDIDEPTLEEDDDDDNNLPFEEELKRFVHVESLVKQEPKVLTAAELEAKVNEMFVDYNEAAEKLGREKIIEVKKREIPELQFDDEDNEESFEEIVDNDAGEELLLQKIAEQESQSKEEVVPEASAPKESSHSQANEAIVENVVVPLASTITDSEAQTILIQKRLSLITNNAQFPSDEEALLVEEIEEIIEVGDHEERYSDDEPEDSEILDDEIIDEIIYTPKTFEEMYQMYNSGRVMETVETEEPEPISEGPASDADQDLLSETDPFSYEDNVIVQRLDVQIKVPEIANPPETVEEPVLNPVTSVVSDASYINTSEQSDISPVHPSRLLEPDYPPESELFESELPPPNSEGEYDDYIDDLEYTDEESLEEEEEESLGDEVELDDYEENSDIDDDDLMKRLEIKYGKIEANETTAVPPAEDEDESWTKIPSPSGGNSYSDELKKYNENLQNSPNESLKFYESVLKINGKSIGALYGKAKSLDQLASDEKSNERLMQAIGAYKILINDFADQLSNDIFLEIAERCLERMRFVGHHTQSIPIHESLINKFTDTPKFKNQLAVTYLLLNRLPEAKHVLHDTLLQWRNDGFALVHYGFVLKNLDNNNEHAAMFLQEGIDSEEPGTQDGRFFYALGDALYRLGRNEDAMDIYRRATKLKLILSPYQRSLYNIDRLKSRPFWTKAQTSYKDFFVEITKYWMIIRDEGMKLLTTDGLFEDEAENLKEAGNWKQFSLYARGQKNTANCLKAPFTCKLLSSFPAAINCKRGQIKFSVMHPGTHVHTHCGPTNCRLRAHLGLKVPADTFLRVATATKSWKEGQWLIFDDSFEHEVWHNGTSTRLVLIVDVWHPDVTEEEKRTMSAI